MCSVAEKDGIDEMIRQHDTGSVRGLGFLSDIGQLTTRFDKSTWRYFSALRRPFRDSKGGPDPIDALLLRPSAPPGILNCRLILSPDSPILPPSR